MTAGPSVHASAVLIGARGLLIRGPSGSGKSLLVLALIQAAHSGAIVFARLVADDRTMLEAANGRLLARPASGLGGLLEVRGLGIHRLPHEPLAVISHVIDLMAEDAARYPEDLQQSVSLHGIILPRIAITPSANPLALVLAAVTTPKSDWLKSD
jgi:HPr kinase/phosphorylase